MTTYRCPVCGYLHTGTIDFHFCPVCSSSATIAAIDNDVLDLEFGKALTVKKCSKCYSLERGIPDV